jgi:hypothetical protein
MMRKNDDSLKADEKMIKFLIFSYFQVVFLQNAVIFDSHVQ